MTVFAAIFSKKAVFEKINYGMSKNPTFVAELPSFEGDSKKTHYVILAATVHHFRLRRE